MFAWWTRAQVPGLTRKLIHQNIHVNSVPCMFVVSLRAGQRVQGLSVQPSHFAGCENAL